MNARLRSITVALKDTDWSKTKHDSAYRKLCPQREHACLDMLFHVLADDIRLQFNNAPIFIVFDNDYANHEAVVKIHAAWCERSGHPGFSIYPKGGVPWDCVPLQCADLVAGLLRVNPFSLAMLNRTLHDLGDDDPVSDIAGLALNNGRGAMWSAPIADEVEAFLKRPVD